MAQSFTPSLEQLKRAIQIQQQIEQLQNEVVLILNGHRRSRGRPALKTTAFIAGRHKGKRQMSSEAREKIAAAQRLRWAKQKKTKG